ncbi:MAG: hypothetical protein J7L23_04010 [Candidatus Diapherotrites archaeon]|nr:hypothetical protein [Candidatus Diapherotrites archaeon]
MVAMERIKTHITGLDNIIEGGFPKGSSILLKGKPGTGKTIFGLQFLYNGCVEGNEAGMLIQIEEFDKTLEWYANIFGWDLGGCQGKGRLAIFSFKPKSYEKFHPAKLEGEFLGKLGNIIESMKVSRIVLDSITPMEIALNSSADYRRSFYETVDFLKGSGATSLVICDEKQEDLFDAEEHICDGVIKLRQAEDGKQKELRVTKMAATNFSAKWYPVTINSKLGFTVKPFV